MGNLVPVNDWSIRGSIEGESGQNEAARDGSLSSNDRATTLSRPLTSPSAQIPPVGKDWATAVLLVQEAAEAIRLGKERASELELEAAEQLKQYHADLKGLHAELLNARLEIEAANNRTRIAEQQLSEATEWLEKLGGAISTSFADLSRPS
jgi:cell division septum initiation protein DivIVA